MRSTLSRARCVRVSRPAVPSTATNSFARPPSELIGELRQEAPDLAGRGFILWCRLETMTRHGRPRPVAHEQEEFAR